MSSHSLTYYSSSISLFYLHSSFLGSTPSLSCIYLPSPSHIFLHPLFLQPPCPSTLLLLHLSIPHQPHRVFGCIIRPHTCFESLLGRHTRFVNVVIQVKLPRQHTVAIGFGATVALLATKPTIACHSLDNVQLMKTGLSLQRPTISDQRVPLS